VLVDLASATPEAATPTTPIPDPAPTPFSFVWVSDTQLLAKNSPKVFTAMAQWIVDNRATKNFLAVLQVGDVVDDRQDQRQWENIAEGMNILKGKLPLFVVAGNHDVARPGLDYTAFLSQDYCDAREPDNLFENGQSWVQPMEAGGHKLLLMGLGWQIEGTDTHFEWAAQQAEKYSDYDIIVVIHSFLNDDGSLTPTGIALEALFERFPQFRLVICGHMHGESKWEKTYEDGHHVYGLMFNLQEEHRNGLGYGYLRCLTFDPISGDMQCITYSPYIDDYNYFDDSRDTFVLNKVLIPAL
jgi:hypothetical protein